MRNQNASSNNKVLQTLQFSINPTHLWGMMQPVYHKFHLL